jgi:phage replication-related protein YjqB (UPF0714/DUF867 family)
VIALRCGDKVVPDRYANFADLAAHEVEDISYRVSIVVRASPIVIVAPHGGEIEPGASQIATEIAGSTFSLYSFEGLVPGRPHNDLHISSDRFDEPQGSRLVEASELAIGVHGRSDGSDAESVWMGGLNDLLRDEIGDELNRGGFKAKTTGHALPGRVPTNICNRGRQRAGVQIELPRTLRDNLVADGQRRQTFAAAVRRPIDCFVLSLNRFKP